MKKIKYDFVNPYDNLDYKRTHGIDERTDVIVSEENSKYYATRNDLLYRLRMAFHGGNILSSGKKQNEGNCEYSFIIERDTYNEEIKVLIPTYILSTDEDARDKKRILDFYEQKSITSIIKNGLVNGLVIAGLIGGAVGFGLAMMSGIEKTFSATNEKAKEYYDEYQKYLAREEGQNQANTDGPIEVNLDEQNISYTTVKTRH